MVTLAPAASTFFLISSASALVTPSLMSLGRAFDEGFGFRQSQAGNSGTDFLDDGDLVAAHVREDHVKGRLLLDRSGRGGATGAGADRRRHGGSGAHPELLFQGLDQLGRLQEGQRTDLVN